MLQAPAPLPLSKNTYHERVFIITIIAQMVSKKGVNASLGCTEQSNQLSEKHSCLIKYRAMASRCIPISYAVVPLASHRQMG